MSKPSASKRFSDIRNPLAVMERIEARLDRSGECWEWTGSRVRGYGMIDIDGRHWLVHRFVFALTGGSLENAVLHRCDNPPCCRPDHLFAGTNADNQRDMAAKGRSMAGERHWGAKLTQAIADEMRARPGEPLRVLAAEYGVSIATASLVRRGLRWV